MKEKLYKYRMESYQLFEYQALEEHLERMARRGWQLEQVGNFFWKYRREDPRTTSYAVTYLPELSAFDPEVTPASRTLDEYCEEAGWEKVCDWTQMQIYRTDQTDPVPLETDEAVRLRTIRRSVRKSYLLPLGVLLLLLLWILISLVSIRGSRAIAFLSKPDSLFSVCVTLLAFVMVLVHLLAYGVWVLRSARSVAHGGPCAASRFCYRFDNAFLVLVLLLLAVYIIGSFASGQGGPAAYFLLYASCILVMIAALGSLRRQLRQEGVSRWGNRTAVILVDVGMALVVGVVMSFATGWLRQTPSEPRQIVRAESLASVPSGDGWDDLWDGSTSPLLSFQNVRQYEMYPGENFLLYRVYEPCLPGLSSWCIDQLLTDDAVSWNEESAGSLPVDNVFYASFPDGDGRWLLAGNQKILCVDASWELTQDDLAVLYENA